jgi:hypothetical protein
MMITHCPCCGGTNLAEEGFVFIEDGPFDGRDYINEGEYARYRCGDCDAVFGLMPDPIKCACGNRITGEIGEDCERVEGSETEFLCEDCMSKPVANEY